MTAYLLRHTYAATHTQAFFFALDKERNLLHICVTLELPWRDNTPQVSCIPEGIYKVVSRHSEKFGWHYHVLDVPGREWILFHPGTYTRQLRGCILPGTRYKHLDADGTPDIVNTRSTLDRMLTTLGQSFTLHILSAPLSGGVLPEATVLSRKG